MKPLAFSDQSLEDGYQQHYRNVTAEYVRWAVLIGSAIMLGFAFQDSMFSPNGYIATEIRFLGALPTAVAIYFLAKSSRCRHWITWLNGFFWISYTFFSIAIFKVYEPGPYGLASSAASGSIFIILFGIFAFSNLPFKSSLLVGFTCLIAYTVSVVLWTDAVIQDFIAGDFLTIFALVLGGSTKSFFEERAQRRQFETSELLSKAYASVEQQVIKRTAELERSNQQLAFEICERTHAEEQLRASEYRFRAYFEKNIDAVVIVNPLTCRLEDANDAALALLHCSSDEVIGKYLLDFTPDIQPDGKSSRDAVSRNIHQTQSQGFSHFECMRQSPYRDPFPVEIVQTWIDDVRSPFILSTWRDISDRKQMEQQLFHAQKLESVGRLAGGVAHDFNNKLSVIMGYTELSLQAVPTDSTIHDYLLEIMRAAEFSRDITSKLLTFSRQQIFSPRRIDPNPVIAESVQSLSHLLNKTIQIFFSPSESLWMVNIDPVQIDQIVMNLALNAADAMPCGGTLSFETENIVFSAHDTTASLHLPGEYVCITVKDEGSGMDEKTLEHIFEPFYTTKEVGKGTGLGLSIIHGIVSQNGGFIDCESIQGMGTTFRVLLPRHLETDAHPGTDDDPGFVTGSCGSILLVEDDEQVRSVITSLLEQTGYLVTSCSSPDQALEHSLQSVSPPDLVLTDVVMPGMPVKEMIEKILAVNSDAKVLYMSGYAADIQNTFHSSGNSVGFIQKPVSLHELNRKITELFRFS
jgi:PAS domain S-box-containing protein